MLDSYGGTSTFFSAPDGLRLHARLYGPENAPAVVCLPGLTRNWRDFDRLARHLAGTERRVAVFDMRGRGLSASDPNWLNYSIVVEAEDVLAGLAALGIADAAFVGTSRGGLIVHVLAAQRPGVLRAVVLNDVGPALGGAGLAQLKTYLERPPPSPRDFAEAVAVQRLIHGVAFPALGDTDWERFTRALYRFEDGRPVLDHDPKLIETVRAIDLGKPLAEMWPQWEGLARVPVLAIRGEHSKLLTPEILAAMERRHPGMESVTVAGQGHAPLLETADLPERIASFLDRSGRAGRRAGA